MKLHMRDTEEKKGRTHVLCACTVVGLILSLAAAAGAAVGGSPPWCGDFNAHISNLEMSRIYTGYLVGEGPASEPDPTKWVPVAVDTWYNDPTNELDYIPTPGGHDDETSWGVFRFDVVYAGERIGANVIRQKAEVMWQDGDSGKEIIGMFYGLQDDRVRFDDDAGDITNPMEYEQRIDASGATYKMWYQDKGLYDDGAQGSSGRSAEDHYDTIGDGLDPVLIGHSVAGDQNAEVEIEFEPSLYFIGGEGDYDTYILLEAGTTWQPEENKFFYKIFPFGYPPGQGGTDAHLRLSSELQPVTGIPGNPLFDWTGWSSDPVTGSVIPEPVTVALLGCGAIGVLLRRRRRG